MGKKQRGYFCFFSSSIIFEALRGPIGSLGPLLRPAPPPRFAAAISVSGHDGLFLRLLLLRLSPARPLSRHTDLANTNVRAGICGFGWGGGVDLSCPLTPPLSVNIWRRVCVKVADAAVSVESEKKEMNRIWNWFWKEERVHRDASQSIVLDPHSSPALSPSLEPLLHASAGSGPSGDALTGNRSWTVSVQV